MSTNYVNYKEFLEMLPIEAFESTGIAVHEDGRITIKGDNYLCLRLPEKFRFIEKITMVNIICEKWDLTVWKGLNITHLAVF